MRVLPAVYVRPPLRGFTRGARLPAGLGRTVGLGDDASDAAATGTIPGASNLATINAGAVTEGGSAAGGNNAASAGSLNPTFNSQDTTDGNGTDASAAGGGDGTGDTSDSSSSASLVGPLGIGAAVLVAAAVGYSLYESHGKGKSPVHAAKRHISKGRKLARRRRPRGRRR